MLINYALSLWIANLGVVPLFSFAFFLFLPALLAFNFLLVRVCIVLEPIKISLSYRINMYLRKKFLSFIALVVKTFVLAIATQYSWADNTLFLAKGEQTEIKAKSLKSFSVGNPEVIKYKYRSQNSTILIKAKSVGFSDIAIWHKDNKKTTYHLYVTSKKNQLQKMRLIKAIKKTSLKVEIVGELIFIKGVIQTLQDYFVIKSLQRKKIENIIFDLQISQKIRNQIIGKVYQYAYQNGADYIKCQSFSIQIQCDYLSKNKTINLSLFKEKYFIHFDKKENQLVYKSFELKFHIISIETQDGYEHSSGFNKIEGELSELISQNKLTLNSQNIIYKGSDLSTHLISSPEVMTLIEKPFELSVGSDVPFNMGVNINQRTEWRFAGLKLKGKTYLHNGKLALKISTQFTNSTNDGISGPRSQTNIYLNQKGINKVFSINIDSKNINEEHIPYLSRIPILRNLFLTRNQNHTLKKINCYVEFKEV